MSDDLEMWTVYDHPADYPQGYIARRFVVTAEGAVATPDVITGENVSVLRETLVVAGLTRLERQPDDDPVILETWL